jgi:hypothetical protein
LARIGSALRRMRYQPTGDWHRAVLFRHSKEASGPSRRDDTRGGHMFDSTRDAHDDWTAACAALVSAEQAGLPDAHLEKLADEIISCRLRLADGPAEGAVFPATVDEQLPLFETASIAR